MSVRQRPLDPGKVAIYIRWSTDDQAEGTTLEVQREACTAYILSQGWAIRDELTFIDDGHSGGSLDRPALTRLREAVARAQVDCVVVFKLDRLSRNVVDTVKLVMDEWEGCCHVKSAREPIDTTTQSGKMFFYTLASYAEWERSVIRERTFSGKLRRAREGRNPGFTPPYGYSRAGNGSFVAIPHEAEVVRRIYLLYRQGHGARAVAALLNGSSVPFRGGRLWNQTTIKNILRNPAYTGQLIYGSTVWDSRRRRRVRPEQPHVVREGVFPVIIPRERWELVQRLKRSRPSPSNGGAARSHSSPHLLTGLLRCGACGRALGGTAGLSERVRYRYYECLGVRTRGRLACSARRIQQRILDEMVARHLKELYATEIARERYVRHLVAASGAEITTSRSALQEAEQLLARVEEKRRHLRSLVLERRVTVEEYRQFLSDVEIEADRLVRSRDELSRSLQDLESAQAEQAALVHAFVELDKWDELSMVQQKELLRRFIERLDAHLPQGGHELSCNITWRVPAATPATEVLLEVPVHHKSRPERAAGRKALGHSTGA